jgi:hypothetical protein
MAFSHLAKSGLEVALEESRKEGDGGDPTGGRAALGKFLTDENFRDRFFTNPEIATWEAGFTLYHSLDPRSPGGGKGGAHAMTDQIVQEPAHKNGKFRGQLS